MDRERRDRFRLWANSAEGLSRWASRLDAAFGGGGKQRSARAVEVALLTGRPLSWWQSQAKIESPITPWYVRLTLPRAVLHKRIEERVQAMIAAGLVDEVGVLIEEGTSLNAPGLDAVGYREVVALLRGEIDRGELVDKIAASTRRYAKRQETWFRHQLRGDDVVLLDATDGPEVLAERFAESWEKRKARCASV
jgi:tRNA dimethylallyltransferase